MLQESGTLLAALLVLALLMAPPAAAAGPVPAPFDEEMQSLLSDAPGLRPHVLRMALHAYRTLEREGLVRREVLTVVDYELPSYEKRLWVIDMAAGEVLLTEWVTHGMGRPAGSGGDLQRTLSFSNEVGTRKSCLGALLTAETYHGKHGYSLRLDGVEPGINDAARERTIVIHGADYVCEQRAAERKVGRSWGCPAVRYDVSSELIDLIRGGSVVWGYYPEETWLGASRLLPRGGNGPTELAAR